MADFTWDEITREEGLVILRNFLEVESSKVDEFRAAAANQGIVADFSLDSLAEVLKWVLDQIQTYPTEPNPSVPSWIRETELYKEGLFDFDGMSSIYILRAGYYFGECFVQSSPNLRWDVGNDETVLANQPVVAGFRYNLELPPVKVVKIMFRCIIGRGAPKTDIDKAIEIWRLDTPA